MINKYDFDTLVNKDNCGSFKQSYKEIKSIPKDVIPFVGAEFEFKTSPYIIEALTKRVLSGTYCYTKSDKQYREAVKWWMINVRKWDIENDWICPSLGILKALSTCINTFTKEDEGVIIQPPIFGAYEKIITRAKRKVFENKLKYNNGRYSIDFEDLEYLMSKSQTKLMVICNPQNPIGKRWSKENLERICELAYKNDIIIYSDEILADMSFSDTHTTALASVKHGEKVGIVGTSLGKSFNFSGTIHSNIIIPNKVLREKYLTQRDKDYYDGMDYLMYTAIISAYNSDSLDWLIEMTKYVDENAQMICDFFKENIPEIRVCERNSGFLLWIDWSAWKLTEQELHDFLEKAHFYVDIGSYYGSEYTNFTRMVIATPKRYISEALDRLLDLVKKEDSKK